MALVSEWSMLGKQRRINGMNGQVDFSSTRFPLKTKPLVPLQGLIKLGGPVCKLIWWSTPKCLFMIAICILIAITFGRHSFTTVKLRLTRIYVMFGSIAPLKMVLRPIGSKGFESAQSALGNKTNGPNSNKLLQHQWASSQWFFYKLGHNAAVSQSIPHFLWDKLDDLCAECGLEDTHTHTQVHSNTHRHI